MAVRIVFNRLPALARRIPAHADAVVRDTLFDIEGAVKAAMADAKSGRVYGDHQASAPGEAPAIDTGAYANDVRAQPTGPARGIVGTNQEQAEVLEYGGADVAARPVWRPVVQDAEGTFLKKMKDLGV
jgi:hypothetical protein